MIQNTRLGNVGLKTAIAMRDALEHIQTHWDYCDTYRTQREQVAMFRLYQEIHNGILEAEASMERRERLIEDNQSESPPVNGGLPQHNGDRK
jgi:hypothetical protein